jgi:hypothetical protein
LLPFTELLSSSSFFFFLFCLTEYGSTPYGVQPDPLPLCLCLYLFFHGSRVRHATGGVSAKEKSCPLASFRCSFRVSPKTLFSKEIMAPKKRRNGAHNYSSKKPVERERRRRRGRRKRDKSCRRFCMRKRWHAGEKVCTPVTVCGQEPPSALCLSLVTFFVARLLAPSRPRPCPELAQKGPRKREKEKRRRKRPRIKTRKENTPQGESRKEEERG